jgi:signal recognition particle GTPase
MSGNEKTEAHLVAQRKILHAMLEEELLDHTKISGNISEIISQSFSCLDTQADRKKEIAQVSQHSITEVNALIKNFEAQRDMQGWFRKKKEQGEALPTSQKELMDMFKRDRPANKLTLKRIRKEQRFNKKQLNLADKIGFEAIKKI